jgi:hypothetical protein
LEFSDSLRYLLQQPFWVDIAKIVLGTFMLIASVVGLIVAIKFPEWCEQLEILEKLADQKRDDTMFEMTAARARIAEVKRSLQYRQTNPQKINVQAILVENAVPILTLVLNKERTIAQLGSLFGKLGMSAVTQFFRKMKGK